MSGSTQTVCNPALKQVLFATDFSASSQGALPILHKLALCCSSTVHVVHALSPEPRTNIPMESLPELDTEKQKAEGSMRGLMASGWFRQIPHDFTVEHGEVGHVIAGMVAEKQIDLVVMGTHGRRG
jgi:nucleotide-binding universal stress UspA family protein